jgi:hypothetical protein
VVESLSFAGQMRDRRRTDVQGVGSPPELLSGEERDVRLGYQVFGSRPGTGFGALVSPGSGSERVDLHADSGGRLELRAACGLALRDGTRLSPQWPS